MRISPTLSIPAAQSISVTHPLSIPMGPAYTVLSTFPWEPRSALDISKVKVPQGEGTLSASMLLDPGTSCFRHADYSTSLSSTPEKSQVALELCPTCEALRLFAVSNCLPLTITYQLFCLSAKCGKEAENVNPDPQAISLRQFPKNCLYLYLVACNLTAEQVPAPQA